MKDSKRVRLEEMPFYVSMQKVQLATKMSALDLAIRQVGFNANPACCNCGKHDWNAFDLMIEAIDSGNHALEFFQNQKLQAPEVFFSGVQQLTCPSCGMRSGDIHALYNYGGHIYQDP